MVANVINLINHGQRQAVKAALEHEPRRGFDEPTEIDKNQAVSFVTAMFEAGLPNQRDEHSKPASVETVPDQPPKVAPLANEPPPKKEQVAKINKKMIQDMQALIKKMASKASNQSGADGAEKSEEANEEARSDSVAEDVQDTYVAQYIRSSLNVALPSPKTSTSGTIATANLTASAFWYDDKQQQPTDGNTTKSFEARSSKWESEGSVLPAPVQQNMKDMRSNYESWDEQLYTNLRLDQDSIRIVTVLPGTSDDIHVKLSVEPLHEISNKYEALSYVWGSPTPAKTIQVNDVKVKVNPNLYNAIFSLRMPDVERSVWIDAICVNQTSRGERSVEVRKMGEIYRRAKTVVVFLGMSSTKSPVSPVDELFKFLNRNENEDISEERNASGDEHLESAFQNCGMNKEEVCRGFVELCLQPWWSRIWIIQEFYLASDEPEWYWGRSRASNVSLKRDIALLMSTSWALLGKDGNRKLSKNIQKMIGKPLAEFTADVRRISEFISRRAVTHGFDQPCRLYHTLSSQATDPRDLVYGLREIFDSVFRDVFVPDYFMRPELLFACLAIFLVQFECWGDMLWWYPHRYESKDLPSWLPDFTRRINPVDAEFLPRDLLKRRRLQPQLLVLDHAICAEGYKLDTMTGHMHVGSGDGAQVLSSLWKFDQFFNRNRLCRTYTMTDEEMVEPLLVKFLEMCSESFPTQEYRVRHPKGSVLDWTTRPGTDEGLHGDIIESLPCWDILMWHAFRVGRPAVVEYLRDDSDTQRGMLEDVFGPKVNEIFRKTVARDFIAACVFDWSNLKIILDRLTTASTWSNRFSGYWHAIANPALLDETEGVRLRTESVRQFLLDVAPGVENGMHPYTGVCHMLLLECSTYSSFMQTANKLKAAAMELNEIAYDFHTRTQEEDLEGIDDTFAARRRRYNALTAQFRSRCFLWTDQGFHGLTSPGVEFCGCVTVLLLDGLSFPVVVRDFDEKEGRGRFVGCVLVRGVDIQNGVGESPIVPAGFTLGERTKLRLT